MIMLQLKNHGVHRPVLVFFIIMAAGSAFAQNTTKSPPANLLIQGTIAPGQRVEASISGGEVHHYHLDLEPGRIVRGVVNQRGVSLRIALYSQDRNRIWNLESPVGFQGSRTFWTDPPRPGTYRLEVEASSWPDPNGTYTVQIAEHSDPSTDHRAAQAFMLADRAGRKDEDHWENFYLQAIAIWRDLNMPLEEAVTHLEFGLRLKPFKPEQAVSQLEQAIHIMPVFDECRWSPLIHNELGRLYQQLEQPQSASAIYERMLMVSQRCDDSHWRALTLSNYGLCLFRRGEVQRALAYYEQSLAICHQTAWTRQKAGVLENIGHCYSFLGRDTEARLFFEEAETLWEKLGKQGRAADAAMQIGWTYFIGGDFDQSLEILQQVATTQLKLNRGPQYANVLDRQGTVLRCLEKYEDALIHHKQSLARYQDQGDLKNSAHVHANMSQVYLAMGQVHAAHQEAELALQYYEKVNLKTGLIHTYFVLAECKRAEGDLLAAYDLYQLVFEQFETLQSANKNRQLAHALDDSRSQYFESYFDLLYALSQKYPDQGYETVAFKAMENNRGHVLEDLVHNNRPGRVLSKLEKAAIAAIENQLTRLEEQRSQTRFDQTEERKQIDRASWSLLVKLGSFRAETAAPKQVDRRNPSALIKTIQEQLLDHQSSLLVWSLGKKHSYVWCIDKQHFSMHQLPAKAIIESRVTDLHNRLKSPAANRSARGVRKMHRLATDLSDILLDPIKPYLTRKRLLIMADGMLHYLPFAILKSPHEAGSYRPLIMDHEMVSLPSVDLIIKSREARANTTAVPDQLLAVFADPAYNADYRPYRNAAEHDLKRSHAHPAALSNFSNPLRSETLGEPLPLCFSRIEAEKILALVPPDQRLGAFGFEASRKNVMSFALNRFQIIHFSAHGVLHPRYTDLSGLLMARYDTQGKKVNGYLRSHEIQNLELSADLVVLSACDTGVGQQTRGVGLWSLSQAFMVAGARSVIVSLWPVQDQASAELNVRFYHHLLAAGKTKSAALREAQLDMWRDKNNQAPFFWAGFILQGDWQ